MGNACAPSKTQEYDQVRSAESGATGEIGFSNASQNLIGEPEKGKKEMPGAGKVCCACCGVTLLIVAIVIIICASRPINSNITPQFIASNLGGDKYFSWWSNPAVQSESLFKEINEELENVTTFDESPIRVKIYGEGVKNLTFGYGSAAKIAELMYRGSKIDGVWEKVPEKFRGVFWMKGNGIAEELTVLQYSTFFEKEQTLLVPMAPFMWGWPAGTPKMAPFSGALYSLPEVSALMLTREGRPGVTFSYSFSPCPEGKACEAGSTDLTYASLQVHPFGDLTQDQVDMAGMLPFLPDIFKHATGKFTLEQMGNDASSFKRDIRWGVGSCDCFEFGGYNLVKILDSDGKPLEPHYSEFIEYMGDVPLFIWSGFTKTDSE